MIAKNFSDANKKAVNAFPGGWRTIAERYVCGWSEIHVRILLRDTSKLCAVFNRAFVDEYFVNGLDGQTGNPHSTYRAGNRKVEMPVLVNVVESVEPAKNLVPIRVRSEARLVLLDDCYCLAVHPLEPAWAESVPGGRTIEQGERCGSGGSAAVDDDKLPCKMVEG